jgi:Tfp pilus assembly PilM family ATPase
MARLIALEWDAREARIVVARRRGSDAVIEHAFAVDLGPRDAGQTPADVNVGERVAAALAARHIGRGETLVAVGRASIELRLLSMPPSPPEELADLVRFQAMRQFSALGDDWPLDYVPLDTPGETGQRVLAAAISPEMVQQLRDTCQAGQLTPRRLVLRPFAAASLLRRHDTDGRCRLMVDLLTDEADLTVSVDGQVVFMRTVRLPVHDGDELNRALLAEIRRTMVAAQNQLGGRRVERIVIFGDSRNHEALKAQIVRDLELDAESFDPFTGLECESEFKSNRPDRPGRYAPLVGMLIDEAAGVPHAIDFLHPRKRPAPPDMRRRYALIGGAVAAAVLAIVGLFWLQLAALDGQIRNLQAQKSQVDKTVKAAEKRLADIREFDKWESGDVVWLDELYYLSEKMPPPEEAIVGQATLGVLMTGGGRVELKGGVREASSIAPMEQSLRSERHEVQGSGGQADETLGVYRWQFTEMVTVKPPDESPPAPPPSPAAAASRVPAGRAGAGR